MHKPVFTSVKIHRAPLSRRNHRGQVPGQVCKDNKDVSSPNFEMCSSLRRLGSSGIRKGNKKKYCEQVLTSESLMPLAVCVNGSRAWLNSQTEMWEIDKHNLQNIFFFFFWHSGGIYFDIVYCLLSILTAVCAQANAWPIARVRDVIWFVVIRLMTLKLNVSDENMYAKITIDCRKSLCDAK